MPEHNYIMKVEWTGNQGKGTLDYRSYSRNHKISGLAKTSRIDGSSDPSFLGDKSRYNPEELLLGSLSACHMLWYLHLCAVNNIIVTSYTDDATGTMEESNNGGGKFKEVRLNPNVIITDEAKVDNANQLHSEANKLCFIANSCNFPIKHQPTTKVSAS